VLILFDIDATLITTSRTGIAAMGEAGRELFGPSFDESRTEYAGRLDPLIIADLLRVHTRDSSDRAITEFRAAYRRHLTRLLSTPGLAKPCPGVLELLDALESAATRTLGLLTGNFPETGAIKLRASGIDPNRFPIQVWGCDSPHVPPARTHLPEVGMRRYRETFRLPIEPADVTIVGDTPHDIAAARAHHCRSLGVATGHFTIDALRDAGADLAVRDLRDTAGILQWLTP
jgi:phosphoglycolate phosphatase-like HAD superfamily hydrolase